MVDLPSGVRGVRLYSGRKIPRGTILRCEMIGPIPWVTGQVPGGPRVSHCAAIVEGEIILDDALWFEHETRQTRADLKSLEKIGLT